MDAGDSAHQRKIELQSADDLAYLVANVRRAAAAHLDEAFPPVEGQEEDELRTQIEALVDEYITKTFDLAAPNLSINGLAVDPAIITNPEGAGGGDRSEPEVVYAPFDARKRARVEELTREEEDLLRDIAKLKKSTPAHAAAAWAQAHQAGVRADEEALERAKQKQQQTDEDHTDTTPHGLAVQERLKKDMPSVVARLERARGAGGYVVTER